VLIRILLVFQRVLKQQKIWTSEEKVSITSLLNSRQTNGNQLGLTIHTEGFSSTLHFTVRTLEQKRRAISVFKRKETLSRNENQKNFYRRLRMAMVSGSSRVFPHGIVPAPSEDGTYTSYVCMGVDTWNANTIMAFAYIVNCKVSFLCFICLHVYICLHNIYIYIYYVRV
jgi:hypothetical protein